MTGIFIYKLTLRADYLVNMSKIDPEAIFPAVEKILYKLSWGTSQKTGIPFEDLRSEAYLKFMECCRTYDGIQSKFSSWLYTKVYFHMKTLTRDRAQDPLVFLEEIPEESVTYGQRTLRSSVLSQTKHLSPEARELIRLIIESPATDEVEPEEIFQEAVREMGFEHGCDDVYCHILAHEIQSTIDWSR